MEGLKLLDVKIEKITFVNDIFIPDVKGQVNIEIGTKVSSKVSYNLQEKKCKCTTTVELEPINYDVNFKLEMSVVGVFDVGENKDNKQMKKDFDKWKKDAKDRVNKLKHGLLTEDEVYEWLVNNK